jgi:hypothetical protein
MLSKC